MNKKEAQTLFILAAIYLVLHYLQRHGLGPEFLRYYGKDLILVPILILGISSSITLLGKPAIIDLKELIITIVVCIIAFEFIFPAFGMAFERDWADILSYLAGGIFYYFVFLKDKCKNQPDTGT